MAARLGTPARRASIAPRASMGGWSPIMPPRSSDRRSECNRTRAASGIVPSRRSDVVPHPHLQRVIRVERSFGVEAGKRFVRQDDDQEALERLGVVDELAQHLEGVDHRRRGVAQPLGESSLRA